MNIRALTLLLLVGLSSTSLAQEGVPSEVRFIVRNEAGQPVKNAVVEGCFLDLSQSGCGDKFKGETDKDGNFRASGRAVLGVWAIFHSAGFYQTRTDRRIEHKRKLDGGERENLERWDVEIPVLLKRIRKPIPMYERQVDNPYVSMWESVGKYNLDKTTSYDLLKGDFLPPYGKGEVADLEFKWKMTIYAIDKLEMATDFDALCEISIPHTGDGICKGMPDGTEDEQFGSAFLSAYDAPLEGYQPLFSFYRKVRGDKAESNDDEHYLYYFRIRTQKDASGAVTSALYGKIYGRINGNFHYFLNPTPNGRNVESDPKQNLFQKPGR